MISVYKLTQAINESASGVVSNNVVAYEFIGGLDEATSEMNYIMMSEAADIAYFKANAEEIMTEAAISNPGSLETLSENVFKTMGDKIMAFLKKLEAMVKGIIEKIKAFFYKLTGKTDKWLTTMRPRITAASGHSGAADQQVELHKWDLDYIATEGGMASALGSMADTLAKTAGDSFSLVEKEKSKIRVAKNHFMGDENREKTGDEVSELSKALETSINNVKDKQTDKADAYRGEIAKALGVDGSNMDEVWTEVTKKATGGEKITMKYSEAAGGKGVDGMLKAIEGSKKSIDALKKAYDKHLADLGKVRTAAEKAFKEESKVEKVDQFPTELRGKYQTLISELGNAAVRDINILESAMNTAKSKHISFVQNMTSEYMSALSKYANYKGKKED